MRLNSFRETEILSAYKSVSNYFYLSFSMRKSKCLNVWNGDEWISFIYRNPRLGFYTIHIPTISTNLKLYFETTIEL